MNNENLEEKITFDVNYLSNIDVQALVLDPNNESIRFLELKEDIEFIKIAAQSFKKLPYNLLSSFDMTEVYKVFNNLVTNLHAIENFNIEPDHVDSRKKQITNIFKENKKEFSKTLIPYFGLLEALNESTKRERLDTFVSDSFSTKKNIDNILNDAQEALSAIKQASGEIGAEKFAESFDKESVKLNKGARLWLLVTAVLAFISFTTFNGFLENQPSIYSTPTAIIYISSRVFIMTLLISATFWCGNMYKIIKHQAAANKFKANALNTFQTFVENTENPDIKDAVLLETTKAIFTEYSTGLIGQDDANKYKPMNIVEIMKKNDNGS